MAKFRFVEWLLNWLLETPEFQFEWDAGNRSKSTAKHGVSTDEVESVFRGGLAVPLGIQESPRVDEERLGLVGPTATGKMLAIAFTLREGKVRPISARPTHKKEKGAYEQILRQITERV
ncbi:MAG: hypothetical protein COV44_02085 [Deltaproteobacteria bacterium CG11_big_fil_rev_8_21_14_0_20_45_16]|nr:MAG: hypothetical protein COV44_02085 [Deltaproteobacteria bacterium CG11_big_fil_rev_8_21_14_0_20_45_16]